MTEKLAESNSSGEPSAAFLHDVLTGLSSSQKSLPCKYFYDEAGSRLFEQICLVPEYYPTRTERSILRDNAETIADACGRGGVLIEPGAGSGEKTRLLLSAMSPVMYVPIDISGNYLQGVAEDLAADFPECRVIPDPQLSDLPPFFAANRSTNIFCGYLLNKCRVISRK